jgi:hypothetical protein
VTGEGARTTAERINDFARQLRGRFAGAEQGLGATGAQYEAPTAEGFTGVFNGLLEGTGSLARLAFTRLDKPEQLRLLGIPLSLVRNLRKVRAGRGRIVQRQDHPHPGDVRIEGLAGVLARQIQRFLGGFELSQTGQRQASDELRAGRLAGRHAHRIGQFQRPREDAGALSPARYWRALSTRCSALMPRPQPASMRVVVQMSVSILSPANPSDARDARRARRLPT